MSSKVDTAETMRILADTPDELTGKVAISDEDAIVFDHVYKEYQLYKNDKGRFLGIFGIKPEGLYLGSVCANKDLSFTIKKGEAVAFLGRNGAGKSTALKLITGVLQPSKGTVSVNGYVSALLELTAGFDLKLTGRENIRLRGLILGRTDEEIAAMEPAVVDFADLGIYIDQPMRSYSSGMRARLGFAIAVAVDPDILVIDEALSVGDKSFKEKCLKRVREIMESKEVTLLFVTHASSTAAEFCSRGIVLDKGCKKFEGSIEEATEYYENMIK